MSLYTVTGRTPYRGHNPGAEFEATLERKAEARALARNSIALVETSTPRITGQTTMPTTTRNPDNEEQSHG